MVSLALAALVLFLAPALGAQRAASTWIEGYELRDRPLTEAFWLETRHPWLDKQAIGWIYPAEPWKLAAQSRDITARVATGTVADVLGALTAADTSYMWTEEGGAVNLMPRAAAWGLIVKDVLDSPIGEFKLDSATLEDGLDVLTARAHATGVKSLIARPKASREPASGVPHTRRVSLRLRRATIRTSLNAMAAAAAPAVWEAYPTDEGLAVRLYALPITPDDEELYPDLAASIQELETRRANRGLTAFEKAELDWQRDLMERRRARSGGTSP